MTIEHTMTPAEAKRFYDRYVDGQVRELSAAVGAFCDPDNRLGAVSL